MQSNNATPEKWGNISSCVEPGGLLGHGSFELDGRDVADLGVASAAVVEDVAGRPLNRTAASTPISLRVSSKLLLANSLPRSVVTSSCSPFERDRL